MTDISALKQGDRIVFSNGHESPVLGIEKDGQHLAIDFISEEGREICLYFGKKTGIAQATPYEIVKVIKHV